MQDNSNEGEKRTQRIVEEITAKIIFSIGKDTVTQTTDDALKVLNSICQQIWKTQQWPQDWKRSVFIPIPKKGNAKECSNCHTIALIPYASKVMLKILQVKLQQYMNRELSDVQAGFRKGRGNRDQTVSICWIIKKATSRKHLLLLYWLGQRL